MRKISIILFLFLIIDFSFGQNIEINNYSFEEGLSQSTVNCIFQASNGIIWIGTSDGLNAFDGYDFIVFRHIIGENSISDNNINDITEDNNGNLIIATNKGLDFWNKKNGKFQQLLDKKQDNNIVQVKNKNGILWALSNKYLFKINKKDISSFKIPIDSSSSIVSNNSIEYKYNLFFDENNNIWIGTSQGIFIFYPKSKQFFHIKVNADNNLTNNIITYLSEVDNKIWIGTAKGINIFDNQTNTITNIFYNNQNEFGENNFIKCFYIAKNFNLVGTLNGLKTIKNKVISDLEYPQIRLPKQQINCIIKDKNNNYWIGTLRHGLYKISFRIKSFDTLKEINNNLLSTTYAIAKDKNNKIWIGGDNLIVLENDKIIHKHYKSIPKDEKFKIYSFLADDNIMWIGTKQGIFISSIQNITPLTFKEHFGYSNEILDKSLINTIFKDKKSCYWIGTNKNGLFEINKNIITQYKKEKDKKLTSNSITAIKQLNDSILILGTKNGINLFNTQTKKVSKFYNKTNGLNTDYITDVNIESDSIIWLTSSNGLFKLNILNNHSDCFSSANIGFLNDFFYRIENLDKENILISSNYGIVKFNKKNHLFYNFGKKDGLPFYEFNTGASLADKDYIYFGGIKGITRIKKRQKTKSNFPINVLITRVIVTTKDGINKTIYFPDSDSVYHFHSSDIIQIFYTITDYIYPKENQYKFKIENLNNSYSKATKNNFIFITGISSGEYTLSIKEQNCFKQYTNQPAILKFKISPNFWQTKFIKFLITFIIIIIISLVFSLFYIKEKKKNKALKKENKKFEKINQQNKILEERANNLKDSLNYASKIIDAMLPAVNRLKEADPQSFIFFKPKDIVSGDFYWFVERNNHYYVAAVDCTGHGIPGAFMSIIGMNLLERFVNDGITDPSVILNLMNKHVILTLKKNLDSKHLKDGMDMSLCIIDKQHKILKFSGAYNPAYIIRNKNIIQLKGDRKTVGTVIDFTSFSSLNIKIQREDYIFLFTDGYTDQFGGPEHKKFKFKRFRELLLTINTFDANKKVEILQETLDNWKDGNEQVDDILIIGFKPYSILELF